MPHPTGADRESRRSIPDMPALKYLDLLHARFPHARLITDELLKGSQTFCDLVEDYGQCAEALDRCSIEGASTQLLNQYTRLRFTLERVLLQYIKDYRRDDRD